MPRAKAEVAAGEVPRAPADSPAGAQGLYFLFLRVMRAPGLFGFAAVLFFFFVCVLFCFMIYDWFVVFGLFLWFFLCSICSFV